MEQLSSKPWYPKGIVREVVLEKEIGMLKFFDLHTEFGRLNMFYVEKLNKIDVFNISIYPLCK